MTAAVGVWPTHKHYVVALGDHVVVRAPRSMDGRLQLLDVLDKLPHVEILLPAPLTVIDPLLEHLRFAHIPTWQLPLDMAYALANVLDVRMRAAHTLARALVRVLQEPALRIWLERPSPPPDPRQLRLL
jgi:hypothetical protein